MSKLQEKKNDFSFITVNEDTDFIPLISEEDEESISMTNVPETLPILPLRNTVFSRV